MVKYCDSAWERCPYAITISHVWEEINADMERQDEIYLYHQVKAMKGELKKLNGRLNKLEKTQKNSKKTQKNSKKLEKTQNREK